MIFIPGQYDIRGRYMGGIQNSLSQRLYAARGVGIEKLVVHPRCEADPLGNHALHKLGASIELAWR